MTQTNTDYTPDWIFDGGVPADCVNDEGNTIEEPTVYKSFEDYDPEALFLYAGIDTYVTSTVIKKQFPRLIDQPSYQHRDSRGSKVATNIKSLLEVYQDYAQPMFEFIVDLEINGIGYDPSENRRLDVSMREEVALLDDRIYTSLGSRINLDSSDDMKKLLYVDKGFTPPYTTKSGDDSTDGGVLLLLAGMDPKSPGNYVAPDPALQYLSDIAKRKNLVSVHRGFISTYMDDYLDRDNRIRALYNQFGTSTFRLSSNRPNLQNIPRAFGVKKCFVSRNGYIFFCFDFSSAEIKLLSSICGDTAMLKAVNDGLDFHSFAASAMYGIPYSDFIHIIENRSHPQYKEYKAKRQTSKALGFAVLYGSSAGGIAMNLNISKEEAERLISLYFNAFPGLKIYIDSTHDAALWNKYVITPLGHRRQFYGTHEVFKHTAAHNAALRGSQNYVIQSSTAIVGVLAFQKIAQEIAKFGGICTATVHDSLEAEIPIAHAAEAAEIFYYYMNDWPQKELPWLGLSIGCEGEFGYNWNDCDVTHRGITQLEIEEKLSRL
jgi:DNA polymerase-1